MRSVILIAVMAVVTILLRFLPFLVFRKETPPYITYLGKVLPPAIIGMLVIYCLKDITPDRSGLCSMRAGAQEKLADQHPAGDCGLHGADPDNILTRARGRSGPYSKLGNVLIRTIKGCEAAGKLIPRAFTAFIF